jgi:hypothetical protein
LLGFLLTVHKDQEKAGEDLWNIINPECSETIPRDKVRKLLKDLTAYSVDVP